MLNKSYISLYYALESLHTQSAITTPTGRHYSHPKYRIARSCGSLPGQSSPAAAAGHREAKSSRRILPTELQLEPLLSLLLQTLLVHAQYVPWPQLVTRLPLQTTSSQKVCNCCHPMNSYYCYGCHQSANNRISRQKYPFIDISNRSSDRYFLAFGGHWGFPEPPVLISLASRISPK